VRFPDVLFFVDRKFHELYCKYGVRVRGGGGTARGSDEKKVMQGSHVDFFCSQLDSIKGTGEGEPEGEKEKNELD